MDCKSLPFRVELEAAVHAVTAAGRIVLDFYERSDTATHAKSDGSPVTDADLAADEAIRDSLGARAPEIPILSEEGQDDERRTVSQRCWIVDPLDGTEQFMSRTGEFDILVALVEAGRPVAVAGYQPTTDTLVSATFGGGAWVRQGSQTAQGLQFEPASEPVRIGTSKWFGAPANEPIMRAIAERLGVVATRPSITGFSPRLFLVPRLLDVMIGIRAAADQSMASEWDFAVADLVIHEAGGRVTDLDGQMFTYNKPIPRNSGGLIAAVDPRTHRRVMTAVAAVRSDALSDASGFDSLAPEL